MFMVAESRRRFKFLTTFGLLMALQIRAKLEYPRDFLLQLMSVCIQQVAWVVFINLIFSNVPAVNGWGFREVAFLYGLVTVPLGLRELFFDGVWVLPQMIRSGEFDRVLIRPIPPVLHVFSLNLSIFGLGNVIVGLGIMVFFGAHLAVAWSIWKVLFLLVTILSGTVIFAGITLLTATLAFWTTDITIGFLIRQIAEYSRFPLHLYPPVVVALLTWVLPFAFMGFLPLAFLLGHVGWWTGLAAPFVAVLVAVLAVAVFRRGVMHYESSGN